MPPQTFELAAGFEPDTAAVFSVEPLPSKDGAKVGGVSVVHLTGHMMPMDEEPAGGPDDDEDLDDEDDEDDSDFEEDDDGAWQGVCAPACSGAVHPPRPVTQTTRTWAWASLMPRAPPRLWAARRRCLWYRCLAPRSLPPLPRPPSASSTARAMTMTMTRVRVVWVGGMRQDTAFPLISLWRHSQHACVLTPRCTFPTDDEGSCNIISSSGGHGQLASWLQLPQLTLPRCFPSHSRTPPALHTYRRRG